MQSYFKYQKLVGSIAVKYGFTPRIGAAVFAALSPNNDYHGNLRDTNKLLWAAASGVPLESFSVSTYGPNKRKAWDIAHGAEPLDLIIASKTRSFFLNIDDPLNPVPVTVDGHMINCWRNERVHLVGLKSNSKLYEMIAHGVRDLAAEIGCIPNQVQGILWITWRRIHRISDNQQEFWDAAYLAARLGFHPEASIDRQRLPS